MFADSLGFVVAYLAFGLVTCLLARKGWPEDLDETLLASVLGPLLLALTATAVAACFAMARWRAPTGGTRGRPSPA
jgi:biotin transporter BioY